MLDDWHHTFHAGEQIYMACGAVKTQQYSACELDGCGSSRWGCCCGCFSIKLSSVSIPQSTRYLLWMKMTVIRIMISCLTVNTKPSSRLLHIVGVKHWSHRPAWCMSHHKEGSNARSPLLDGNWTLKEFALSSSIPLENIALGNSVMKSMNSPVIICSLSLCGTGGRHCWIGSINACRVNDYCRMIIRHCRECVSNVVVSGICIGYKRYWRCCWQYLWSLTYWVVEGRSLLKVAGSMAGSWLLIVESRSPLVGGWMPTLQW